MAKLDTGWAIEEIDKFLHVTAQVGMDNSGGGVVFLGTVMRGSESEAAERAHVVEKILDRVLPGWHKDRPVEDRAYRWLRNQASRAKSALQRQAELAEKLGDNAPDMDAANLHPWAWENGMTYWNKGFYHQAVMQASLRINTETQVKLSRMEISETDLFNQAFSLSRRKRGLLGSVWPRTTAGRRTRTCIAVPGRLLRACTPRSVTRVCTSHTRQTAVRNS